MKNILYTRLKLLLRDKAVCFCYLVSIIVMIAVFLGLNSAAEERSTVPIGLVNQDDSVEAAELASRIRENKTFYVYEKSRQELDEMLMEGYINSIFIIKDGYGDSLLAGEYEKLITVISAEDDKISVVLSDIIAGDMVFDIAVNRAYNRYNLLSSDSKNRSDFIKYVAAYGESPEYTLPIEFVYIDNNNGKIDEDAVTNGMIYKQMIAGMICMLIGIVAFTSCNGLCLEFESGIVNRRNNLPGSKICRYISDFLGILIFTSPLAMISGAVMAGLYGVLITLLYLVVLLVICYCLAIVIKRLSLYQLVGVVVVVGLGIAGFVSVFSGLVGGGEFLKYTPNGLYIEWFISL